MENLVIENKRKNGVYYTPEFLADYISGEMQRFNDDLDNVCLLDPAVGEGILVKSMLKKISDCAKIDIVGVDTDNDALSILQHDSFIQTNNTSFTLLNEDSLSPFGRNYKEGWKKIRNDYISGEKFNLIISNPPWGANIDKVQQSNIENTFQLAKGQYDIYNLFVELIINQLADKGIYGLIIPDSIFNFEHESLRRLLLNKTKLLVVGRLGEKIFSDVNRACTIIIGTKEECEYDHKVKCFRLNKKHRNLLNNESLKLEEIVKKEHYYVPQTRFLNNNRFNLNIDLKTEEEGIVGKIESSEHTFYTYTTSTRGVELSKKGVIVKCPSCDTWFPKSYREGVKCSNCGCDFEQEEAQKEKIIINDLRNGLYRPIKVGEDIDRYNSKLHRSIKTQKKGINYKNLSIYDGPKILVRKTGVGITATIDYDEALTNQVVYIFKLKEDYPKYISLEMLLGLLNSRVYTFYLLKKNGENEWKSHPYITLTDVKNLPIPNLMNVDRSIIIELEKRVRQAVKEKAKTENDIEIEKRVLELFGLTKDDYKTIMDTIRSCDQLLPFKRLLNIKVVDIFSN